MVSPTNTSDYFDEYNEKKIEPPYILHFTCLVRLFLSSKHPTTIFNTPIIDCKTATRLEEAGMKFKPLENECLLNIRAWSDVPEREGMIKKGELWHDQKIDVFSQVQECRSNK